MEFYLLFWVAVVGLCLGSFYNVVILRSLSNESIVFPASKCPKCGHKLYFWHNIPVLSYILLRGKCYFCKEKISVQYPLIELATMGIFVATFINYGFSLKTLFILILSSLLLIMTMTDLKEKLVDCNLAIAMAICGVMYNIYIGNFINSILGIILGIFILELVARLGYLFTKSRAMGEADTYVAAALGACFGYNGLLMLLLYSLFAAMLFALPIYVYRQYKKRNTWNCILMVLFILSLLVFRTLWMNYFTMGIFVLIGIALVISVIRSIDKSNEPLTYLPFVPAFMLATLFYVFLA